MFIQKIIANCSFVERVEAVKKAIELAKSLDTVVHLTVYRDSMIKNCKIMISKTTVERKVIRYIENELTTLKDN